MTASCKLYTYKDQTIHSFTLPASVSQTTDIYYCLTITLKVLCPQPWHIHTINGTFLTVTVLASSLCNRSSPFVIASQSA